MLNKDEIDFLMKLGAPAESARWNDVIIDALHGKMSKQDIFDYYSNPTVRSAILSQIRNNNAIVHQNFTSDAQVLKRWEKGQPIQITKDAGDADDPSDYSYWIERRGVEFHPTLGPNTKTVWVDIDPKDYDWKKTKALTGKVADVLYTHPDIDDVKIRFSGGRGFYVIGSLNKERPTDEARALVNDVIKELVDKEVVMHPPKPGQVRLDTSTLKNTGSIRGIYSLNKHTGLVSVPVEEEHLYSFQPEHATPFSVLGGRAKRAKPFRV